MFIFIITCHHAVYFIHLCLHFHFHYFCFTIPLDIRLFTTYCTLTFQFSHLDLQYLPSCFIIRVYRQITSTTGKVGSHHREWRWWVGDWNILNRHGYQYIYICRNYDLLFSHFTYFYMFSCRSTVYLFDIVIFLVSPCLYLHIYYHV